MNGVYRAKAQSPADSYRYKLSLDISSSIQYPKRVMGPGCQNRAKIYCPV